MCVCGGGGWGTDFFDFFKETARMVRFGKTPEDLGWWLERKVEEWLLRLWNIIRGEGGK